MLAGGRHVQIHEIFLLIVLPVIKLWGGIWPIYPEGRPGMSDISPLSGISGLSFDSPFLSLLLFFCLVLLLFLPGHFSANGPFSLYFSRKLLKYFLPRVRLSCMALVEQLGDDRWQVVCASCSHMTLVFVIMHLYNIF